MRYKKMKKSLLSEMYQIPNDEFKRRFIIYYKGLEFACRLKKIGHLKLIN